MAELNMTDTFIEVKKVFNIWAKRTIIPLGRVAVLKSLIHFRCINVIRAYLREHNLYI